MKKSIISNDYILFLAFLKQVRVDAGITQEQLAKKLKATQSFLSKVERGERRLDVIELRQWSRALGLPLSDFVTKMEKYFKENPRLLKK